MTRPDRIDRSSRPGGAAARQALQPRVIGGERRVPCMALMPRRDEARTSKEKNERSPLKVEKVDVQMSLEVIPGGS